MYTVQRLRNYLLGKPFEILVDHCALCALNKVKQNSPRLQRWAIVLSEYDIKIRFTKGNLHEDIDCLSRQPVEDGTDSYLDKIVYTMYIPEDLEEWTELYNDPEIEKLIEESNSPISDYKMKDKLLYYKNRLYVPSTKRQSLTKQAHGVLTAHGGSRVTSMKLKDVFWPEMQKEIKDYISKCSACQLRKIPRNIAEKPEIYHHESYEPMELVAIDSFHTNKASRKGNKIILVAIDCFSKFIIAQALSQCTGTECTEFLMRLIGTFGKPAKILTDNAHEFTGVLMKETTKALGIKTITSTPGHSEGNSVVERAIQTIQERLTAATLNSEDADWDDMLSMVILGINTSYHTTTRYTPYELMFARECKMILPELTERNGYKDIYVKTIRRAAEAISTLAILNTTKRMEGIEWKHQNESPKIEFKVGDKVLSRNAGKRDDTKLGPRYNGPFEVVKKTKDVYDLKHLATGKAYTRHAQSLKPFMTCLLLMSIMTVDSQWVEVSPLQYIGTEHIIEDARTIVDINIAILSPCDKISMYEFTAIPLKPKRSDFEETFCDSIGCYNYDLAEDKTKIRYVIASLNQAGQELKLNYGSHRYDEDLAIRVHGIKRKCIGKFRELMDALDTYERASIVTKDYYPTNLVRKKRSWYTEAGKFVLKGALTQLGPAAAGTIAINMVTDLIKAGYEYLNPNSNTNKIEKLNKQVSKELEVMNLQHEILDKLIETTKEENAKIEYDILKTFVYDSNRRKADILETQLFLHLDNAILAIQDLTSSKVPS